jgi:hypothetical protein
MAATDSLPLMKQVQAANDFVGGKGVFISFWNIAYTFIGLNVVFLFIDPIQTLHNYALTFFLAPLWMTPLLMGYATERRLQFRRADNLSKKKYILLELRLPRDTRKTPLAMETFFSNMHFGPGEATEYKVNVLGNVRPWWSFEIVSIGGRVHFYVWTLEQHRRGIESYLYSQYPDMEIIEAEDYSRLYDPADYSKNRMFGEEFIKTKADPYPIKTYVDYGLDKSGPKPEEQVDPLAQIIELLGSIGPKEQYWIQFIIRLSKDEKYRPKINKEGKAYTWKDIANDEIEKIRALSVKKTKQVGPDGKVTEIEGFPNPTKGQGETINAIERNVNKAAFDIGIRTIYSAPEEAYQGGMIAFFMALWKPFSNENGNGFKPATMFSAGFNDYPWEDKKGIAHRFVERKIVDLYRRRSYFVQPYVGPWSVMSTEELATLFHIPSSTIETPSLPRIQSSTSGAPANLPT